MSNMKCPFCNEELEPIIGACEDTEYYCQNCDYMTGDENLWNQLIKYKQALDIAVDALKYLYDTNDDYIPGFAVPCGIKGYAKEKLEQITALEQKGE